jgi:high affinity Mn2+ porin
MVGAPELPKALRPTTRAWSCPALACLLLGYLALCTTGCSHFSRERWQSPGHDAGEQKPADQAAKTDAPKEEAGKPGPRTLPEAVRAYFHSLCWPPASEDVQEKKSPADTNGRPNDDASNAKATALLQTSSQTQPETPAPLLGTPSAERSPAAFGDSPFEPGNGKKDEPQWYSAHAQGTIVSQAHGHFTDPYSGPFSFPEHQFGATSETATVFLAARLWESGGNSTEIVFDPEIAGGLGFNDASGIAGYPNGEITRVGVPEPSPYIARLYVRQTIGFGGEQERVEDSSNQIASKRDIERLTIVIGKLSFTDLMDDNRYSHDPRTQFLNWGLMYNAAWDYPANVRGYDYGVGIEWNEKDWALRYGIMAEPEVANGAALDRHILNANGQAIELEERYFLNDRPGKVRLMAYLNHAHMGNYGEALAISPVDPEVTATRAYRFKYGFCASLEQELCGDIGFFARFGWNDGHAESWAFTSVDDTAAIGLLVNGQRWQRRQDQVGLALLINGLSNVHKKYLEAGGLDFNIGDGALHYGPEVIVETYYNFVVIKGINVTGDFQGVENPAYNRDRGPIGVWSLRVHMEF